MTNYYSIKDYKLLGFELSNRQHKKYMSVLQNKKNNKYIYIHFGDNRYQQYHDKIGDYKDLNHNDKQRRLNYHQRHQHFIRKGYYSPGYFSMKYLW